MTDKEMLELVAKAAGIEIVGWMNEVDATAILSPSTYWEPLYDDGDALRLAVKLGLNIMQMPDCPEPWVDVCGADSDADELYKDDPYAATRRAIVRAAAEIGKGMK